MITDIFPCRKDKHEYPCMCSQEFPDFVLACQKCGIKVQKGFFFCKDKESMFSLRDWSKSDLETLENIPDTVTFLCVKCLKNININMQKKALKKRK